MELVNKLKKAVEAAGMITKEPVYPHLAEPVDLTKRQVVTAGNLKRGQRSTEQK